jgi:hypothetical protein
MNEVNARTIQSEDDFANSSNFKRFYISYQSFDSNYLYPNFFDNLNQSLTKVLPFILFLVCILKVLFKIFFHKPISLLFRKFEFWGILLIMMFEGSIENLTFFSLAEFKAFFSACFKHKLLNLSILLLFFLLLFTVIGLLFWAKFHYGQRVKYLLDESQSKLPVIWGIIIDRGIICVLFGSVHQLLINAPNLQLFVLAVIEILWIIKKVIFAVKGLYS